ncbi:MAG TPA: FkbM family methyltransferase, partial [bacterium]|nr:FkbM family methyltransferase [bacterium]
PGNLAMLTRNLRLNGLGQVQAYPWAVGDRAGPATLFRSPDNQGDHRLFPFQAGQGSLAVKQCCLDDLPELAGSVRLLKVDAQGWEVKVLRGAARMVAAMRGHGHLLLECWPHGLQGAGDVAAQLLQPLQEQGWRMAVVDEQARILRPISATDLLRELEQPWYTQAQGFCNLWLE